MPCQPDLVAQRGIGVTQKEDSGGPGNIVKTNRMALTSAPSVAIALMVLSLSITAGCSSPQALSTKRHSGRVTTSPSTFVPPPTSPPTTAPPTTQAVVASTRCQPPQMRIGLGPAVSEPTGQRSLLLTLTNVGSYSCYLFGYPGITLYDDHNELLPLLYQRHGDVFVTGSAPQRVGVAPGSSAFVLINKYRCDLGDKVTAGTLRLIPPDDTTSMTLGIVGLMDLSYCGPGDPGSTLEISPVEPTSSATTAH